MKQRLERGQLSQDDVLAHLKEILFLDPIHLFESNGSGELRIRPLKDIPIAIRRCISKIKTKTTYNTKTEEKYVETEIELMSKDNALNLAMKHLGLILADPKINVGVVSEDFLADLLLRVEQAENVIDVKSKGA